MGFAKELNDVLPCALANGYLAGPIDKPHVLDQRRPVPVVRVLEVGLRPAAPRLVPPVFVGLPFAIHYREHIVHAMSRSRVIVYVQAVPMLQDDTSISPGLHP